MANCQKRLMAAPGAIAKDKRPALSFSIGNSRARTARFGLIASTNPAGKERTAAMSRTAVPANKIASHFDPWRPWPQSNKLIPIRIEQNAWASGLTPPNQNGAIRMAAIQRKCPPNSSREPGSWRAVLLWRSSLLPPPFGREEAEDGGLAVNAIRLTHDQASRSALLAEPVGSFFRTILRCL